MIGSIPENLARISQSLFVPRIRKIIIAGVAVLHRQLDLAALAHLIRTVEFHSLLISIRLKPIAAAEYQLIRFDKTLGSREQNRIVIACHIVYRTGKAFALLLNLQQALIELGSNPLPLLFQLFPDLGFHALLKLRYIDECLYSQQNTRNNDNARNKKRLYASSWISHNPFSLLISLYPVHLMNHLI